MPSEQFSRDVTECLGDEWASYVKNKRRGGDSGEKGVRFEDLYAAYHLASSLVAVVNSQDEEHPVLEQQADAIVDDLVIRRIARDNYYQCKNSASVSWSGGDHPIQDDFAAQIQLHNYQKNGVIGRATLVVPSDELAATLRATVPANIAQNTDVDCFPYFDGRINRVAIESTTIRPLLAELARVDNPDDDQLADVLGALMMGIRRSNGKGNSEEMLHYAQSLSPHLIRLLPAQVRGFTLDPECAEQLAKIEGLVYGVSRGFFHWSGYGTSGVFSQNCLSPEFRRFQARVIASRPSDFDAFEVLL